MEPKTRDIASAGILTLVLVVAVVLLVAAAIRP